MPATEIDVRLGASWLPPEDVKLITNASKLLLLALVAGLFAGCVATRPISDVALGVGGAYLGHELSNGDPLAIAAARRTESL